MNTKKWTKRQIDIKKLDLNRYKEKDTIKQNSNKMNKNKKTSK